MEIKGKVHMMFYNEEWRPIQGYDGLYEVSNTGRVRSLGREIKGIGRGFPRFKKPMVLKQAKTGTGYYFVTLTDNDGNHRPYRVHRLVGNAFIPNIENKEDINHIDGNKLNNNANNLEWATRKENIQHAFRVGLAKPHHNQINKKKVEISKDGFVKVFDSIADAALFIGVAQSGVSRVCSCKLRKTGGYKCRFV